MLEPRSRCTGKPTSNKLERRCLAAEAAGFVAVFSVPMEESSLSVIAAKSLAKKVQDQKLTVLQSSYCWKDFEFSFPGDCWWDQSRDMKIDVITSGIPMRPWGEQMEIEMLSYRWRIKVFKNTANESRQRMKLEIAGWEERKEERNHDTSERPRAYERDMQSLTVMSRLQSRSPFLFCK